MARALPRKTKPEIAALVKSLEPGRRAAVGEGITVTKDSSGRIRFQWRARVAGRGSRCASGTHDSFDEAARARATFLSERREDGFAVRERGRKLLFDRFVDEHYFEELSVERTTLNDYDRTWERRIKPYWKGYTLGQIAATSDFKPYFKWLEKQCKHKGGASRGQAANSSLQKAVANFLRILNYAVREGYLDYNPFQAASDKRRFDLKRKNAPEVNSHRQILADEVPELLTVELIRYFARGRTRIETLRRRALVTVLAYIGLRPGEALFLRWHHLLGAFGELRPWVQVHGALADLGNELLPGDTKTHRWRNATLWAFVGAELLALRAAHAVTPSLDDLVFPNEDGGYYWWGNSYLWWYRALCDAGLITEAEAGAHGAFPPRDLRHLCASLLHHVERPAEDGGGRYSPQWIARHMGHTVQELENTYAHVIDDDFLGADGRTMEEVMHWARRELWGPLPGDPDYKERLYTTNEVSELIGLKVNLIGNRIRCGTLKAEQVGARYLVSEYELNSSGLLVPARVAKLKRKAEEQRKKAAV